MLHGVSIYAIGDTVAALLLGQFSAARLLGMMCVGATFYALEIPNYFKWIDRTVTTWPQKHPAIWRTGLALLYFNPLWISRHLFFIFLFSGRFAEIDVGLLRLGFASWLGNIPLSLLGNYLIQVKIPLRRRFAASAVFSSAMAVYYALSERLF